MNKFKMLYTILRKPVEQIEEEIKTMSYLELKKFRDTCESVAEMMSPNVLHNKWCSENRMASAKVAEGANALVLLSNKEIYTRLTQGPQIITIEPSTNEIAEVVNA